MTGQDSLQRMNGADVVAAACSGVWAAAGSGADWNDPARDDQPPSTAELWAAIEFYAGQGRRMFPVAPRSKLPRIKSPHEPGHRCRGECGRDGHGCYDATTDLEKLDRWWHEYPDALIGFATGHTFDVLDLDHKVSDDGQVLDAGDVIDSYVSAHGLSWGPTGGDDSVVAVATPGGGLHLYVQPVAGGLNRAPIDREHLPGCDYRALGGLVVAPPSWSAKRGRRYVWAPGHELRTPPTAPSWLTALVTRSRPDRPAVQPARVTVDMLHADATPYAARVLAGCVDEVTAAQPGHRNAALNGAAYRCGRFVAGGELSGIYAAGRLVAAAVLHGAAQHRAEAIVDYAFAAAATDPARTPDRTGRKVAA